MRVVSGRSCGRNCWGPIGSSAIFSSASVVVTSLSPTKARSRCRTDWLTVDLGFEIDEIDRIIRGESNHFAFRQIDVRKGKCHGQGDRRGRDVGKAVMHADAFERYLQVLAVHCNVRGAGKLKTPDREFGCVSFETAGDVQMNDTQTTAAAPRNLAIMLQPFACEVAGSSPVARAHFPRT